MLSATSANGDTFLSTAVIAPRDMTGYVFTGALKPAKVWLNGEVVTNTTLQLKSGANPLVLQYTKPGPHLFRGLQRRRMRRRSRTQRSPPTASRSSSRSDLATSWWTNANVLRFDVRASEAKPVGWYRFRIAARLARVHAQGAWQSSGVGQWRARSPANRSSSSPKPSAKPVTVLLRVEQERGCYGGAAFDEPIQLDCGAGEIALGDWSQNEGLACYSGGAWYRKTVKLPAAKSVTLDLGNLVSSAEVRVNGQPAGIRVAPPWTFDITRVCPARRQPHRSSSPQHAGESLPHDSDAVSRLDRGRFARAGADSCRSK